MCWLLYVGVLGCWFGFGLVWLVDWSGGDIYIGIDYLMRKKNVPLAVPVLPDYGEIPHERLWWWSSSSWMPCVHSFTYTPPNQINQCKPHPTHPPSQS